MKISLGCDHAGFEYKEAIKGWLAEHGHEVKDFGTFSNERVDYPDFIRPAAEAVAHGECERGIVLGGSGNGEAIVANRVRGIRCGVCWNEQLAIWNRAHNDGNVLSIGQRTVSEAEALQIVRTIIELARVLGMDVVAEGIETCEQYRLLRQMGCRLGQGFLFARPMAANEIAHVLRLPGRVLPDPEAVSPLPAISMA